MNQPIGSTTNFVVSHGKEKWEEEFDQKFDTFQVGTKYHFSGMREAFTSNDIKSFIKERFIEKSRVEEIKEKYRCGKCDGARVYEHTAFCKAFTELLS